MRILSLTSLAAIAIVTACQESPTSPEPAQHFASGMAGLTAAMGQGAAVSHNCAGEPGTVLEVVTPVSATDFWATDVEMVSSQCVTTANGKGLFKATARILSEIPLPLTAVSVDLADEDGVPGVFNVIQDGVILFTGSFPCGDPSGLHGITFDCTISTTPSGIQTVEARFE
jgi:hypothetical protein